VKFVKRLFSPPPSDKSETPLFDMLLAGSEPERRDNIKKHFEGLGNDEILAIYHGPYCEPVIDKINNFATSKSGTIRVVGQADRSGGWVYYVRGIFDEHHAQFLLKELHSCVRGKDAVYVTKPKR
jgi:hypothetical protein